MKTKSIFSLLIPLLFYSYFLQAQNLNKSAISGVVCDSLTKKPLIFCTVLVVRKADSTFAYGTITTKEGNYQIDNMLLGLYKVIYRYVGYQSKVFNISIPLNNVRDTIFLTNSAKMLKEVNITASTFERDIDKLIMNTSQINLPEGSSTVDLIKEVPGAYITPDNSLTLLGKEVRIFIDDKPLRIPFDKAINILNNQSSNDIGKIEIMFSPPPKYIDEWNGPMLNIITKKKLASGFYGNITNFSSYGKYPRDEFSLDLNYRTSRLNAFILLDVRSLTTEVIKNISQTNIIDNQISFLSETKDKEWTNGSYLATGIGLEINAKSSIDLTYNGNYFKYKTKLNDSIIYAKKSVADTIAISSNQKEKHNVDQEYNVFYKYKLNSESQFTIEGDFSLSDINESQNRTSNFYGYNDYKAPLFDEINRDRTFFKSKNLFFRIDHTIKVSKLKIESGLKYSFITIDNNFLFEYNSNDIWHNDTTKSNSFSYKESILSGYISVGEQISSKFGYQLSLRGSNTWQDGYSQTLDNQNKTRYFKILPSLFMNYSINNSNEITLNYDRTIGRPYFETLNPFILYDSPALFTQGNPDLIPELSDNIRIMHRFKTFLFSTISYIKRVNSNILRPLFNDAGDMIIGYKYFNFGSSETIDFSSAYSQKLLKNKLTIRLIPSISYSVNNDKGSDFYNKSLNYDASLIATYTIDKNSRWMLNFFNSFNSGFQIGYSDYGKSYRCGISMSRSFLHNSIDCALDINDIFNSGDRIINSVVNNVAYRERNIPDSRFLRLRMSYSFSRKNLEHYDRHEINNEEKNRIK